MHGVVLTSELGEPLRPAILWADTRSSTTLNTYHSLNAAILERLGNPITAGWLAQLYCGYENMSLLSTPKRVGHFSQKIGYGYG
ncbi:hypothetical protein ANSO36C_18760 [Nostoc cf. commune SO-36]|uniref:Xylulose kinase n=1 Tax=Nostoc cf. commune SO-36 TaxID=449208 RepID=A0ABM7YZE2_NOSCO|nr:hypothetical protein ANSO36C_18760 [Nostoc cf. commune SO-36]